MSTTAQNPLDPKASVQSEAPTTKMPQTPISNQSTQVVPPTSPNPPCRSSAVAKTALVIAIIALLISMGSCSTTLFLRTTLEAIKELESSQIIDRPKTNEKKDDHLSAPSLKDEGLDDTSPDPKTPLSEYDQDKLLDTIIASLVSDTRIHPPASYQKVDKLQPWVDQFVSIDAEVRNVMKDLLKKANKVTKPEERAKLIEEAKTKLEELKSALSQRLVVPEGIEGTTKGICNRIMGLYHKYLGKLIGLLEQVQYSDRHSLEDLALSVSDTDELMDSLNSSIERLYSQFSSQGF